ncbi:MAG: helix-turn-helix domain-containing protein [Moraxella sp.]|nr:helix-turn-helix domain-containing protein [Moraxella sp.]
MYTILIDDQITQQLTDKAAAFANFRAYCRDYANKPKKIVLMCDDDILHTKTANMQLHDDVDEISANDILMSVMSQLNVDIKALKNLLPQSPLLLSNSRIDGWVRPRHDRRFAQMYNDELQIVLHLLLTQQQDAIKSPQNISALRQKLGLTQTELAKQLGLTAGHRQVARWEAGEAEMPDSRWQKMQGLL